MPTDTIYLIGAGGHAKVVLDALLAGGVAPQRICVCDDAGGAGRTLLGLPVSAPAVRPEMAGARFHVAIGDAGRRALLHARLLALGASALSVLHPRALVSAHAHLDDGVFIAAGAVLGPDARLGAGVIVNHHAVVDHDCQVGAFSHIAPGATLGGAASVGARVLVGAGARILPGCTVGMDAVIGAGAVVLAAVDAGTTQVGVPAKLFKKDMK